MPDKKMSRWEPFRELVSLRDDMDRLFSTFFGGFPEEVEGFWSPVIDIEEDDDNYFVKAEIPGMKKEDVKISVRGNALSVSGERKQESETKNKTFHRIEQSYGKFMRTITLPSEIDTERVKATYKDGILTVTLPKPEATRPKEIEVEVK